MPRTLQEILDHQDEIAKQIEDYEPTEADRRDPEPFKGLLRASEARGAAEALVAEAVAAAREAGYSWATIGSGLGTSASAAHQKYGKLVASRK